MKLQTGALVSSKGIQGGSVTVESGDYLVEAAKGIEVRESERNPGVLTHIIRTRILQGPELEDGSPSKGKFFTRFLDINPDLEYGNPENFRNDKNVDEFHDWLKAGAVKVSKTGTYEAEEILAKKFHVRVGKRSYTGNDGTERYANNVYKIEPGE